MYLNEQYYLERSIRLKRIVEDLRPEFQFQPLRAEHKDLYMEYQPATMISSRCFLSLYAYAKEDEIVLWEDQELGYLCLLHLDRENRLCSYPPLGVYESEAYAQMIQRMRRMFVLAKEPFHMDNIEEHEIAYLERLEGFRIFFSSSPDEDDYVFETAHLTNYDGPENASRRKHRNKFLNQHEVEVHRIEPENWADCERVMDAWCAARECSACGFRCPRMTAQRALRQLDALNAMGSIMYMDKQPEAIMLVGRMSADMVDSIAAFAIHRYPGLTYTRLEKSSQLLLSTTRYLNLEEDLGIPNLRKFKQSLHPALMVRKYSAHLISGLFA